MIGSGRLRGRTGGAGLLVAMLIGCGGAEKSAPEARRQAADVAPEPPRESPLDPVYTAALEGDMRAGMSLLGGIAPDALDQTEKSERDCLVATFRDRRPPRGTISDPFVADLVAVYRDYWTRVLLKELEPTAGETHLRGALGRLFDRYGYPSRNLGLDPLLEALGDHLSARGFHSIRGITLPYYDLMAWERQEEKTYRVALPETSIDVKVVFMDDFAVLGWSALATCNKHHSGGWATGDALYCVADAYDTASEQFRVSYLAHEAQHFADYARFPALEQPELEYRAKLVEIALATTTAHELVLRFAAQTGQNRSAPHNFANGRVVRDLAARLRPSPANAAGWRRIAGGQISRAAREALASASRRIDQAGAATTTRFLDP